MEMSDNNFEERNRSRYNRNRRDGKGLGFAFMLILIGGIFLLLNIGAIPGVYKSILISWQMLLIAMGLWGVIVKRQYVSGGILTAIGFVFIYPKLYALFPEYLLNVSIDFSTYWPLILIAVGLFLVMGKRSSCSSFSTRKDGSSDDDCDQTGQTFNNSDFIKKDLMFGSSQQIVLSENFQGGEGNVMFGELNIDLRKATLAEGEHILETNVMFGSTTVFVPKHWQVEVKHSTIFGSVEDHRSVSHEIIDKNSKLIIKGSAMFGSCEIRN